MDFVILLVRVVLSLLLYVFLGAVFILLWRDLKAVTRQQPAAVLRERPGRLRVLQGGDTLEEDGVFALEPFTTVGRSDTNTIIIADPNASAERALIVWRGGQWWLEDRGSRNGTLLNDIPVDEPLIVSSGDVIGVGHVQLRFELINPET